MERKYRPTNDLFFIAGFFGVISLLSYLIGGTTTWGPLVLLGGAFFIGGLGAFLQKKGW